MTLTQTVEIPLDRRVHFDFEVPREIPTGRARIEFKVIPFAKKEEANVSPPMTTEETQKWIDNLKVLPNKNMTAEEEKEFFEKNAEWLNREAEDVLRYQVDIFSLGDPDL